MPSATSPLAIPAGTYLALLGEIEKKLPELLSASENWQTLDVDYHPPRVERVWLSHGELRICLHRIHPADPAEILFHPHPWPSSMKVLQGTYEMGIGSSSEETLTPPAIVTTLELQAGSSYEMVHPHGWHYVNPKGGVTYSLMISGLPWPERDQKSGLTLNALSPEAKAEILSFFRGIYPSKKKEYEVDSALAGAGSGAAASSESESSKKAAEAGAEIKIEKENTYLFSPSESEKERLKRLNEVYNPNTQEILSKHLSPGMSVLEIGPGTGDMGEWVYKTIGETGSYAAIDLDDAHFPMILSKIPGAFLIKDSIVTVNWEEKLEGKKFDLIYFRWVLGYTPTESHLPILEKLYGLLNPGGKLIAEEFNLYAAHCVSALSESEEPIENPKFAEWIKLSQAVDQKFNAKFSLGNNLPALLTEATHDSAPISVQTFQGVFHSAHEKSILGLGMRSAREALTNPEHGIKRTESYDDLTRGLDALAEDPRLKVKYILDTAVIAEKPADVPELGV
jgi:SAM-dependent methyltransferase